MIYLLKLKKNSAIRNILYFDFPFFFWLKNYYFYGKKNILIYDEVDFIPWTPLRWTLRAERNRKLLEHSLHGNGLSPVWIL